MTTVHPPDVIITRRLSNWILKSSEEIDSAEGYTESFFYTGKLIVSSTIPVIFLLSFYVSLIVGVPTESRCYPYTDINNIIFFIAVSFIFHVFAPVLSVLTINWWKIIFNDPSQHAIRKRMERIKSPFLLFSYIPWYSVICIVCILTAASFAVAIGLMTLRIHNGDVACRHRQVPLSIVFISMDFCSLCYFAYVQHTSAAMWANRGISYVQHHK